MSAVGTPAASAHKGGGHHPSPPSTPGKAVFFADNLARFRGGQPLQNVVDLARGY